MWQNIAVFIILALVAGASLWSFYKKFTGKSSCCGGACTCKNSCGSRRAAKPAGNARGRECGALRRALIG